MTLVLRLTLALRLPALLLALLLTGTSARATPADLFGMGASSQGSGATGAAVGSGYAASYINPALLVGGDAQRLSLGYLSARFDPRLAPAPTRSALSGGEALQALMLGLELPLPLHGVLERRLTLGFAGIMPGESLARVRLLRETTAQYPLLADRAQSLNLAFGLGANLGYGFRVGAGVLALAKLSGDVSVSEDAQGQLRSRVDDRVNLIAAPALGLAYEYDVWRFGLSYRGELASSFSVLLVADDLGAVTLPPVHVAGMAQYDPASLQGELGVLLDQWRFALGVLYRDWSRFPGFLQDTVQCPASTPDCGAAVAEQPRFSDTLSPRAGAAYRWALTPTAGAELRAGVFYEPSPLSGQSANAQLFDAPRIAFTAGYGLELLQDILPLTLDLALQQHLMLRRSQQGRRVMGTAQMLSLSLGVAF